MKTKLICSYLGGSGLYGLNTYNSDVDVREVVLNQDISYIVGTKRFDQQTVQNKKEDRVSYEARGLLDSLSKGKVHAMEAMWLPNEAITFSTEEYKYLSSHRKELLNGESLYSSLRGFTLSEKRRAFEISDTRQGEEASKRRTSIENYGYFAKSVVHVLRLCYCGKTFFNEGYYPVRMPEGSFKKFLLQLKTNPEHISYETVLWIVNTSEKELEEAYIKAKLNNKIPKFNEDIANKILLDLYMPSLLSEPTNKICY